MTTTTHTFIWAYRHTPTGQIRPMKSGAAGRVQLWWGRRITGNVVIVTGSEMRSGKPPHDSRVWRALLVARQARVLDATTAQPTGGLDHMEAGQ